MEFASTHIYAYDESDEEEMGDLVNQSNPLYMTFGSEGAAPIGEKPQRASAAEGTIYDNAGRFPPGFQARGQAQGAEGIYDNAGHLPPGGKARGQSDGGEAIYDNRPVQPSPAANNNKEESLDDLYASPYDLPRDLHLYQDIKTGRPLPPSNPPPVLGNRDSIQATAPPETDAAKPPSKKIRKADTNVIAVHFEKLVRPSSLHANKPIYCTNCGAVFSHLSSVADKIWRCEFCDQRNNTKVSIEDLQQKEDSTFVLHPPSEAGDETLVIFCMDVSGSMSVTSEVDADVAEFRQNDVAAAYQAYQQELQLGVQAENPYVVEPKKRVSYVSRLQAMQTAIDQQLSKMQTTFGNKRVGLVAFNDLVTIIGDGTDDPMPLEGASLTDKDTVISLGCSIPLPQPISEVRRCLSDKVFSLVEGGQTALGPSLLISTAIASQKAGSKVIICTDGKANVGLGNLDVIDDDETYEKSVDFYDQVGDFARDAGICVSVLTVEGEDCRAIELGNVADKTGGKVTVVDPLQLGAEFDSILEDNILATNVSVKLILHTGLYTRDDQQSSVAIRNIGNVKKESETTFEFGIRVKEVLYDNFGGTLVEVQQPEEEAAYDVVKSQAKTMIEGLEKLPFQLQVKYTDSKGGQYLRVITLDKPVTKDRQFAEQNANVAVIGAHAAQSAAKLAVEGNYAEARINALVTQKLVERHVQGQGDDMDDDEGIYQTFVTNMAPIHSELQKAQTLERNQLGHSLSDVEEEDEYDEPNAVYQGGEFIERKKRAMTKKVTWHICLAQGHMFRGHSLWERVLSKTKVHSLCGASQGHKRHKGTVYGYEALKAKQRRKKISDHQANLFYKMKNATSNMFHPKRTSYSMTDQI